MTPPFIHNFINCTTFHVFIHLNNRSYRPSNKEKKFFHIVQRYTINQRGVTLTIPIPFSQK